MSRSRAKHEPTITFCTGFCLYCFGRRQFVVIPALGKSRDEPGPTHSLEVDPSLAGAGTGCTCSRRGSSPRRPDGPAPEGALLKKEEIVGRGVISTIFANEPFIESRLAPKGGGAGLAALIPNGMRAVAIRVNEIVGVAGFVVPGMRVDVLVSGNPPGNTAGGSVTKTLLQYVEVLSAGQNFQKDTEGKPVSVQVVNLLVTPEQAEMLSLASSQTTIQLVLRNPLDTQIAKTPGTAVVQLFRSDMAFPRDEKLGQPAMARPTPRPIRAVPLPSKPRVVEVILGIKRAETQFTPAVGVKP